MRLSDLQNKTVINLLDGKNIGNIIDMSIDESGKAIGLIVEKRRFIISFFTNKIIVEPPYSKNPFSSPFLKL